jgi:tRNA(Phe) wybutosine-synthesizing methylase Tyw3
MACCSPPSTTTRLSAASLAKVKGKVQLAHTAWKKLAQYAWLRHSKKYVFMGHCRFLGKKHPYRTMDCQFNGEKDNREASLHVTGDLVHLKVKDIKNIEELSKLTEKTLGKRKK